nr:uncharacterized protein LOC116278408 [Vicugna pacos]
MLGEKEGSTGLDLQTRPRRRLKLQLIALHRHPHFPSSRFPFAQPSFLTQPCRLARGSRSPDPRRPWRARARCSSQSGRSSGIRGRPRHTWRPRRRDLLRWVRGRGASFRLRHCCVVPDAGLRGRGEGGVAAAFWGAAGEAARGERRRPAALWLGARVLRLLLGWPPARGAGGLRPPGAGPEALRAPTFAPEVSRGTAPPLQEPGRWWRAPVGEVRDPRKLQPKSGSEKGVGPPKPPRVKVIAVCRQASEPLISTTLLLRDFKKTQLQLLLGYPPCCFIS